MIEELRRLLANHLSLQPGQDSQTANSAVLVPLFELDRSVWVLFIKRSENIGLHRGQMGFPGGMAEPADGGDLLRTALRECEEETGILPDDVEVIGQLRQRSTIVSGLRVQPYVGIIPWPYGFSPDPLEVQSVHPVDLEMMVLRAMEGDNRFNLPPPVYPVDDEPVWGLTARIVTDLLEVLKPMFEG
jgi:8-oxo-dGTP pyrophosphatase MutT (NUDIX family)